MKNLPTGCEIGSNGLSQVDRNSCARRESRARQGPALSSPQLGWASALAEETRAGSEHVVRIETFLRIREVIKVVAEVPPPVLLGHSGNGADQVALGAYRHSSIIETTILGSSNCGTACSALLIQPSSSSSILPLLARGTCRRQRWLRSGTTVCRNAWSGVGIAKCR